MVVLLKPLHAYVAAPPVGSSGDRKHRSTFYRRDLKGGSVEIPPFSGYRNASPPATVGLMTGNTMLAQLEPTSRNATNEVVRAVQDLPNRTKFTPENVRQIINLVERGKSKEEIADIIGVTTGTLQVTCSKLGVSLRRPRFDTGTGMLGRGRLGTASSPGASSQSASRTRTDKTDEQPTVESPPMQNTEMLNGDPTSAAHRSASVTLAIKVHYKGKEKSRELPLTADMIGRVALEAEFRGLGTGELIARLITDAIEKDLVDVVLGER
jgi:hypothetical protein